MNFQIISNFFFKNLFEISKSFDSNAYGIRANIDQPKFRDIDDHFICIPHIVVTSSLRLVPRLHFAVVGLFHLTNIKKLITNIKKVIWGVTDLTLRKGTTYCFIILEPILVYVLLLHSRSYIKELHLLSSLSYTLCRVLFRK